MRELTRRFEVNVRGFLGTVFFEIIIYFLTDIRLSCDSVSKLIIWAENYFFKKSLPHWGTFLLQNQKNDYTICLCRPVWKLICIFTLCIQEIMQDLEFLGETNYSKLGKVQINKSNCLIEGESLVLTTHYRSTKVNMYMDISLWRFPDTGISAFMHMKGHISAKTCTPAFHSAGGRVGSPRDSAKILFLSNCNSSCIQLHPSKTDLQEEVPLGCYSESGVPRCAVQGWEYSPLFWMMLFNRLFGCSVGMGT